MADARAPAAHESPDARSVPRVRTLLVCDLAESTALVERLGDGAAAELLRKHDRVARDLLHKHAGREIDKTDGFLALFERPVEAVAFALAYQRALRPLGDEAHEPLRARVGIHIGEVVLWENSAADISGGAKPVDVEGLAKPVAARLMALAMPGQILLSGIAFSLAQRAAGELPGARDLRWLTHGRYRFKGVPAPMLVHEVGESGLAPLHAPPSTAKAERDVPLWRKPGVLTLEAILIATAIAIPFILSLRAPPAIAFGERDWVVMGDLRNLTGEPALDASLETAFRISLEQSRYVNLLPDLKLRDTLARMQRPQDTEVDRAVASEIALREGARAVILPTVAEVGGRVRVSAEVIDPHTQTTVYAESSDGVGAESALESIDKVTHELRARLGEALSAIDTDSAPLPRVTSANLDALRAYALGVEQLGHSELADAMRLFDQALSLDPDFALARIAKARVQYIVDDFDGARASVHRAMQLRDRLTPRDALYVEAWDSNFGPTAAKLERWRLLGNMYPDYYAAHYNYALFALEEAGQPQRAIEAVTPNDVPQNPFRDEAHYLRATALLWLDRVPEAQESFRTAMELGASGRNVQYSMSFLAAGDAARAREVLDASKISGDASSQRFALESQIALAISEGKFERVATLEANAARAGRDPEEPTSLLAGGATLLHAAMTLALQDEPAPTAPLQASLDALLARSGPGAEPTVVGRLITMAWIAARAGHSDLAQAAADAAAPRVRSRGVPLEQVLLAIARAETERARGNFDAALQALEDERGIGPVYAWHVTALRVHRERGDAAQALREAEWLASHPGAAVSGAGVLSMLRPAQLLDWRLALLDLSELQAEAGRAGLARKTLDRFSREWPTLDGAPRVAARVKRLRQRLEPAG